MKKIIIASALALAAGATAQAKTADELRIYINPGHGSWTGGDRPMVVIGHSAYDRYNTDTTSFFESNTNLRKGFGLLEKLRDMGLKFDPTLNQTGERWQIGAARDMSNNIVMSHVKCGPYHSDNGTADQLGSNAPADIYYYNRLLSVISAEVDANNFDMFISIHSNAASEGSTANYPLYLYRGHDTPTEISGATKDIQTTSRTMANTCWDYSYKNAHMTWSNYSLTNKNIRGDIDFYHGQSTVAGYTGYLGVLKHGVPGFLVEGYFHTYQPARHRAMNWDVDYIEGYTYAHGIADYFGISKESKGDIYGIVRDNDRKFSHTYYIPNSGSDDRFQPINGAKVKLMSGNDVVAQYTTDNNYNGAFVFKNVEPGDYTIDVEYEGCKVKDGPIAVTVTAADIAYPKVFLVDESYVAPSERYDNYPDEAAGSSITPADEYKFRVDYSDESIEALAGTTVRRMIAKGNRLYILSLDSNNNPVIIVYDAHTRQVLTMVSTEGMDGTELDCSDIQLTADGVLVASSKELCQSDEGQMQSSDKRRGELRFYKWDNDENGLPAGEPKVWLTPEGYGNFYRSYSAETFAYTGTSVDGMIVFSCETWYGSGNLRNETLTITDGQMTADEFFYPSYNEPGIYNTGKLGSDFRFVTSPLAADKYFVVGSGTSQAMTEYDFMHTKDAVHTDALASDVMYAGTPRTSVFKYAGASYMAAPYIENGVCLGVKLIDISDGIANAAQIGTYNTVLEGSPIDNASAAGATFVTRGSNDEVTAAYIDLYLLREDGLVSRFTTSDVEQPKYRNEYAYNLSAENADDMTTVSFDLTGDVRSARLVMTDRESGNEIVQELGALHAGSNTADVTAQLEDGAIYDWAISVENRKVTAGLYSADASGMTDVNGGVVPITDPSQKSFGYTVVSHGKNRGYDVYNPAGEKVATRIWANHPTMGVNTNNESNPQRGHEFNGMAVFAGWGDTSEGVIAVDPIDAEAEPYSLYAGTNDGTGNHVYEGINLGGGTPGVAFTGTGDATRMYTFSEDHEGKNGSGSTENSLAYYNIGSDRQVKQAPVIVGFKGRLANTNVGLLGYGDGVFASQVRGSGNNTASVPGFIYVDAEGNEQFNSSTLDDLTGCNSAVAITRDGKTLAVAETQRILVYNVEWDGAKPALTFSYAIDTPRTGWGHMRFDYAGNLHYYQNTNQGYAVYTLPGVDTTVSTPAAAIFAIQGASAVSDIVAGNDDNAPVEYYNLQGVRVAADNLTPGIYIRRQGRTATKISIK